jgi:GWxTD domain-containing protein
MSWLRSILIAVAVIGAAVVPVWAWDDPNRLTVYGGVTVYPNPELDTVVLVEFPFSLKREELEFYRVEGGDGIMESRVLALVRVLGGLGTAVDSAYTYFVVRATSPEDASTKGIRIFNKLSLLLRPGSYTAQLTVVDAISRRKGEYPIDLVDAQKAPSGRISLSGTQWAYGADFVGDQAAGVNMRLVRNGFLVLPNPKSVYGISDSVACFYTEVYNLAGGSEGAGEYQLEFAVLNESRQQHAHLGTKKAVKAGVTAVIAECFDIKGWPTGLYWLKIAATDLDAKTADTALEPFRIISPDELFASLAATNPELIYDTMSLETRLHMVQYLLTPEQSRSLSQLSDEGKERFLEQYWAEQERQRSDFEKSFRLEIIERFLDCNRYFSTYTEAGNGWLTARGRIYMLYGPYEAIDDIQAPLVGNAYQIWYYFSISEGRYFIFEDIHGDNDYRLVHSNVKTEIHSKEWQQLIDEGSIDIRGY